MRVAKARRATPIEDSIEQQMRRSLVGQDAAIDAIAPFVRMYDAGLSPDRRPVGVFALLGPTGTGKTKTVEVLANAIHGNPGHVLRIDCGEFQSDHEVAKLIGAPPGYLGHRETQPALTQAKLNAATSERSSLSLVLFDEIEKAAPSMARLLLGVLDKASLRLGDNNMVSFERTMIFMTSNLGSAEMQRGAIAPFGFPGCSGSHDCAAREVERIGMAALRRKFAPEFVNRIDQVISYRPLGKEQIEAILSLELEALQNHLFRRLGHRTILLAYTRNARRLLADRGFSPLSGARELKRTITRLLLQPLAEMISRDEIAQQQVTVDTDRSGSALSFVIGDKALAAGVD